MKTELKFDDKVTKELLATLKYDFFLERNIEQNKYTEQQIRDMEIGYQNTLLELNELIKINKNQYYLYIESQVRRSFINGHLASIFNLIPEQCSYQLINFKEVGLEQAYFEKWQEYYSKKIFWNNIQKHTTTILAYIGGIFGIVATILKLTGKA